MKGEGRCWQFQGNDSWAFGPLVRGVVRGAIAEVHFDDELKRRPGYGWVWVAFLGKGKTKRGVEGKLEWAVEKAERALGVQ